MNPLLQLFLSLLVSSNSIIHDVQPNKTIKKGYLKISLAEVDGRDDLRLSFQYELKTHWYSPLPDQKGNFSEYYPKKYASKAGYEQLEKNGEEVYEDLTLQHLGRGTKSGYKNGHYIRVIKESGEWSAVAFYHPTIASTGWHSIDLTFYDVPVMGDYTIHTKIRKKKNNKEFFYNQKSELL